MLHLEITIFFLESYLTSLCFSYQIYKHPCGQNSAHLPRIMAVTQFTGEFRWNSPKILKTSMQSRVIILIHDDVGLVVLPAGMYHDVSRFRRLKKKASKLPTNLSFRRRTFILHLSSPSQKHITGLISETSHQCLVVLIDVPFFYSTNACLCFCWCFFSAVHLDDFIWFQCFQCHANPYLIPLNPGCFKKFIYRDCSWIMIILPSGSVSKPWYPCSSHQNSWDLWMFIPLKMVLIGIDP
jgi:hypothetical protein